MHEKVAEKFAELFAACAVKGEKAELQKEAAAHNLVKSAEGNPFVSTVQNVLSNPYVYVPAATAAAGGALGYGTSKKKDKMRNALHYALMGGLTGLGGVAAAKNMPIFGGGAAAPDAAGGKPAAKPDAAADAAVTAPTAQEMLEEHAKKTSIGQPGTRAIPVGAGVAGAAAGGGVSDAVGRSWFRRAGAKGELNHVPHAVGTAAHYTDPAYSQRLPTALNAIFDDDTDPLKIRKPLQGPLTDPDATVAWATGKTPPTSLGLGPVSDADRLRLTTDVEQMLKSRSLGPMNDTARRVQNSALLQELSRRANGHAPDAMELLNKYHAGRKMGLPYRIISALLPAIGAGVSANRAADAWQNSRANIPAQEQPK